MHLSLSAQRGMVRDESTSNAPALSLIGIGKRYASRAGALVALHDVSFDIRQGEFISLIGPSGCGKTTLFNIVGGLIDGFEGDVFVRRQEIARPQRRLIGMVFQEESAFPWRTTFENVAFPLEVAGVPRQERLDRARHFLRHWSALRGSRTTTRRELSGGMLQRTVLARTLAFEPQDIADGRALRGARLADPAAGRRQGAADPAGARADHAADHTRSHRSRSVVGSRRGHDPQAWAMSSASSTSICRGRGPRRSSGASVSPGWSARSGTTFARKRASA